MLANTRMEPARPKALCNRVRVARGSFGNVGRAMSRVDADARSNASSGALQCRIDRVHCIRKIQRSPVGRVSRSPATCESGRAFGVIPDAACGHRKDRWADCGHDLQSPWCRLSRSRLVVRRIIVAWGDSLEPGNGRGLVRSCAARLLVSATSQHDAVIGEICRSRPTAAGPVGGRAANGLIRGSTNGRRGSAAIR